MQGYLLLLDVGILAYLLIKKDERKELYAATLCFTFVFIQTVEMILFGPDYLSLYGSAITTAAALVLKNPALGVVALVPLFLHPSIQGFSEVILAYFIAQMYLWIYGGAPEKARFEMRRKSVHMFGGMLILLFLWHFYSYAYVFFFLALLAILIAVFSRKIFFFSWLISEFERENVFPAKGAVLFLIGAFVGSTFGRLPGAAGIMALIWLDSTTTLFGILSGRTPATEHKTWEGEIVGLLFGFAGELALFPPHLALAVSVAAMFAELLGDLLSTDDNLLIPIFVGAISRIILGI